MAERKRARTKSGKFIPDDPNTPENEAWTSGKAPKKKTRPNTKLCFCVAR